MMAMEILYSDTFHSVQEALSDERIGEFLTISDPKDALDDAYIKQVVESTRAHKKELEAFLSRFLKQWTWERLSRINQSILLLAGAELLILKDVPEKVALNEAIVLAKHYSDEDSNRFINAVLDQALKNKESFQLEEDRPKGEQENSLEECPPTPQEAVGASENNEGEDQAARESKAPEVFESSTIEQAEDPKTDQ